MTKKTQKKILIIDDDSFIPGVYMAKLEAVGYQVSVAKNGKEGLEMAEKLIPALILLDLMLPQINGFGVIKALKSNKGLKNIPIIITSNLSETKDIKKALSLGADDYLIKAHFTPTEVVAKVEALLRTNKPKN